VADVIEVEMVAPDVIEVELAGDIDVIEVITGGVGGVANVQGVTGIWAGTQSAYDALAVKSSTTLYVIT
jgi:hypothetical protein